MKIPNWLKIIWWFLLAGFFAYLVSQRYDSIVSGSATATDIVIFLILIALLTIPLFQEVSLFGLSFKKEIDKLKTEFKEQIINLRSDIQTINMKAEISPQIYLNTPPSDAELPSLKKQIQATVEEVLKSQGIQEPVPTLKDFTIPDDTIYLISVRYTIEQELRRIWKQWQETRWELRAWSGQVIEEQERPKSIFQITRSLDELGIITPELSNAIREVYRVCSPAIHGEAISQTAIGFVRDIAPELIAILKTTEGILKPKRKPEE